MRARNGRLKGSFGVNRHCEPILRRAKNARNVSLRGLLPKFKRLLKGV